MELIYIYHYISPWPFPLQNGHAIQGAGDFLPFELHPMERHVRSRVMTTSQWGGI
jgi:hypothetical protein